MGATCTWRGDWSESSSCWTAQFRHELKYPEGGSAGIFFMCLTDFVKNFTRCTICKIRGNEWCEARMLSKLPSGVVPYVGLEIEAFETTECSVSLLQPQERLRAGIFDSLFEPLACIGFVVLPISGPSAPLVDVQKAAAATRMHCRAAVSVDCWLQPGHSYVVVPLSFHDGAPLPVTCACVSSRPVLMQQRSLHPAEIAAAWAAYA